MAENDANMQLLESTIERVKTAQKIYATYTQEQVDEIFRYAALIACQHRIPLAKMAVEETRMGIVEDKIIKNHFASEYIYNKYKNTKTCDILERDDVHGLIKIAQPLGIIAGVVPTTNPTSTAIFKALLALKTRNGIIFSPHPRAKKCTVEALKIVLDAAVKAGAPKDIIAWFEEPTIELSGALMKHKDIALILATGGPGMVKAAYSSGNPSIGVGPGNTPAVIDETADIQMAVSSILMSKTFDNGTICASEQTVVVVESIYDEVKKEFAKRGAYLLNEKEAKKVANTIVIDHKLNSKIAGQYAWQIAEMAGLNIPHESKVLIGEAKEVSAEEPFAYEKLSPVLGLYKAKNFEEATEIAEKLIAFGGNGHTSVLYTYHANKDRIEHFSKVLTTCRVLINTPASQGAIGDLYNFRTTPSLTLGCGSYGKNSVSGNISVEHLLNIKTVAEREENMLWFKLPPKIYFKKGCTKFALRELEGKKKALIITDKIMFDLGYTDKITSVLEEIGVKYSIFSDVCPDPTINLVKRILTVCNSFEPDVIIAVGGGSPIDAAKMTWFMYEQPNMKFEDVATRFMDIRKRVFVLPQLGKKAELVCIPTTSGTGSEVTPFTIITDEDTGNKYALADYTFTPNMAIVDPDLAQTMPKGLAAASGFDSLVHAIEAYVSTMASPFTDSVALQAIKMVFANLEKSVNVGDFESREEMHYAANLAGMAFSNAFLGMCHSMAHKLGARFHIPHGIANAYCFSQVIKFNASEKPTKQGTFPQYKYPKAGERYAEIADFMGFGGKTVAEKVDNLIKKIEELKANIGIAPSIKADPKCKFTEKEFMESLDKMSEMAFDDQCTGSNPRYPLISEIKELYIKAYNGDLNVNF